uniref:Uncharacterized protein n=1 Tax=Arundo donax TaxID=35708 RepID=A0A0A9BF65_ARUDO
MYFQILESKGFRKYDQISHNLGLFEWSIGNMLRVSSD